MSDMINDMCDKTGLRTQYSWNPSSIYKTLIKSYIGALCQGFDCSERPIFVQFQVQRDSGSFFNFWSLGFEKVKTTPPI